MYVKDNINVWIQIKKVLLKNNFEGKLRSLRVEHGWCEAIKGLYLEIRC